MSNTCGVDRDDPNMKEGYGVPFMIEDCFSKRDSDWNLPSYDNDCCKKYLIMIRIPESTLRKKVT